MRTIRAEIRKKKLKVKSICGYSCTANYRCSECDSYLWEQRTEEYCWYLYCCLCDITVIEDYGDTEIIEGLRLFDWETHEGYNVGKL